MKPQSRLMVAATRPARRTSSSQTSRKKKKRTRKSLSEPSKLHVTTSIN